jgi:hypothetical protein
VGARWQQTALVQGVRQDRLGQTVEGRQEGPRKMEKEDALSQPGLAPQLYRPSLHWVQVPGSKITKGVKGCDSSPHHMGYMATKLGLLKTDNLGIRQPSEEKNQREGRSEGKCSLRYQGQLERNRLWSQTDQVPAHLTSLGFQVL